MPSVLYITGGAGAIGRACARLALEDGARVALIDRDGAALERVGAELADALPVPCDVRDEDEVRAAFSYARDTIGRPTGVIASAAIDRGGALRDLDADAWDAVLAVNLRGTFLTCREALRHMADDGGGSIVCVSSPLAFVAVPGGTSAYSASKGAVSALVRTIAVDYARHGVRVNALLPGPTDSELMWANVPPGEVPAVRERVRAEVPLERLAEPDEPARAALWLLSDSASYVTGAQIPCDGGVLAKASISV
jgi:NAD(P)-dependent dehydrogenase (short-subunit alcohol dehydrogenase family)